MDKNWKQLKADEMRMNPTPPEAMLWGMMEIMNKVNDDAKDYENSTGTRWFWDRQFERQVIVHGWIVDFFFPKTNLVVEVDGKYHNSSKRADAERDKILYEKYGIKTLRFTSKDIYTKGFEVVRDISDSLLDAYTEMSAHGYKKMIWPVHDYIWSVPRPKRSAERKRLEAKYAMV